MLQNMSADSIASINMKNIKAFAETFLANPNKHVEWLANSGNGARFSRTLFLLVVLQALVPSEGMIIFAVVLLYTIEASVLYRLSFVTYNCLFIIIEMSRKMLVYSLKL